MKYRTRLLTLIQFLIPVLRLMVRVHKIPSGGAGGGFTGAADGRGKRWLKDGGKRRLSNYHNTLTRRGKEQGIKRAANKKLCKKKRRYVVCVFMVARERHHVYTRLRHVSIVRHRPCILADCRSGLCQPLCVLVIMPLQYLLLLLFVILLERPSNLPE